MTQPDDYRVIFRTFPGDVYAAVRIDTNGYPTIYINEYLAPEARRRALLHELEHVGADHMYSHVSIYDAEADAIRAERISTFLRSYRTPSDAVLADVEALGSAVMSSIDKACGMPFPERLEALRKLKKLTRAEAGELIGVDSEQIRRFEAGKDQPDRTVMDRLSRLFGVAMEV